MNNNYEEMIIDFYYNLIHERKMCTERSLINADYFLLQVRIDTIEKLMDECGIKYDNRKI